MSDIPINIIVLLLIILFFIYIFLNYRINNLYDFLENIIEITNKSFETEHNLAVGINTVNLNKIDILDQKIKDLENKIKAIENKQVIQHESKNNN